MIKQEHMNFKQALIAHLNGEAVEIKRPGGEFLPFAKDCAMELRIAAIGEGTGAACEFRLAPRTVTVNGVECVAPEMFAPKNGALIYTAQPGFFNWHSTSTWSDEDWQNLLLDRRLVFLNKEHAIAYAKAMCNYKEGEK